MYTFFFTWVPNFKRASGTICPASLRTFTSSPASPWNSTINTGENEKEKKLAKHILSQMTRILNNTHTHTQTNYLVLLHEECMSNTLFTSPSSPPNSVDIVLCGQRKTIVDHHFNIRNIQSSSSYVSSYLRVYGHVNRTNRLLEIVNDHYRSSHVEMRPFQSILSCACTCKKTQKLSNKIQ